MDFIALAEPAVRREIADIGHAEASAALDDMIGRLASLQAGETMLSWCTRLALTARDLEDCARIFSRAAATPAPPRQERPDDPVWPPPGPGGELAVLRVFFGSGPGICPWNGNKVAGRFYGGRAGRLHGYGIYTWRNGQRYDGQLREGNFHGRGAMTWPNGDRYDGTFRDGKENGRGVYTWANGDRYEGEWRDGKAHGTGTKTARQGRVFSGEWSDGCFRDGARWATAGVTRQACGFR